MVRGIVGVLMCVVASTALAQQPGAETSREPAKINEAHPLAPALKRAYESRKVLQGVRDYEANFTKRELFGRDLQSQQCRIRAREEPFSVYLYFVKPNEGREVIYNTARNKKTLLAHDTGLAALAGVVELAVDSPQAMEGNHYDITNIGIHRLLDNIITQWETEAKYGEIEVNFYPNAKLGNLEVEVIESKHPKPRNQFRFHKTQLFIDKATNYPIRVEQFGFPTDPNQKPPVVEEYTYSAIRPNIRLTNQDFDVNNPKYKFK